MRDATILYAGGEGGRSILGAWRVEATVDHDGHDAPMATAPGTYEDAVMWCAIAAHVPMPCCVLACEDELPHAVRVTRCRVVRFAN